MAWNLNLLECATGKDWPQETGGECVLARLRLPIRPCHARPLLDQLAYPLAYLGAHLLYTQLARLKRSPSLCVRSSSYPLQSWAAHARH